MINLNGRVEPEIAALGQKDGVAVTSVFCEATEVAVAAKRVAELNQACQDLEHTCQLTQDQLEAALERLCVTRRATLASHGHDQATCQRCGTLLSPDNCPDCACTY